MCGIAGIITPSPERYRAAAERMATAMDHRGPDDVGFETLTGRSGQSVLLVHRRLSILDLSPAGHQPMLDPGTGNWIVFNGEIYNFVELRAELEQSGLLFTSGTDTEVILKGYGLWGSNVLRRLRGMFALAIYDARKEQFLLARDRLGIKPLYFQADPTAEVGFIFASEVRALLASDVVKRRLSPAGLACYLALGYVADPLTIIDGVESLLPARYMVLDAAGRMLEHASYWTYPTERAAPNGVSSAGRIRKVLDETVRQHMISDVPLGAFLSGGVDSSALVGLMAGASPHRLQTFSLVFEDPELDEGQYSRAVAERFRTDHHEVSVTEAEFLSLFEDGLAALDQPTTDAINSYVVSRKCKETGLTVAIAGTGGDELFGGYTSFQRVPRALAWLRAYHALPRWARTPVRAIARRALVGANGHLPSTGLRGKMAALLDLPADGLAVYQLSRFVLLPDTCEQLLQAPDPILRRWGVPEALDQSIRSATVTMTDVREQISVFEQSCYLANQLLRDTDCVSMAVSLEVRVPFLDHALVETISQVPPATRFGGPNTKELLIESVRDLLPPSVYERRKQGFVLPMGRWLAGPLAPAVANALGREDLVSAMGLNPGAVQTVWKDCQSAGQGIYFTRLWSLFVLADWCRRHEVYAA